LELKGQTRLWKREIKDDRRIDRYRRMITGDEMTNYAREEGNQR
jgi:hypothetical protein